MAVRLAIVSGNRQVYAHRKDAKEVTLPLELGDLGVEVAHDLAYPPYQSVCSWAKFWGGYWREATADDIPIPNIEELVLKAEKLGKPVDVLTGEATDRRP
jgi:hypothetical protein